MSSVDPFHTMAVRRQVRSILAIQKVPRVAWASADTVALTDDMMGLLDAMTAQWPSSAAEVAFPLPAEVRWPGMDDSLLFILPRTTRFGFLIVSKTPGDSEESVMIDPGTYTEQFDPVIAVLVTRPEEPGRPRLACDALSSVLYIHANGDVTTGGFPWGGAIIMNQLLGHIIQSTRWERSLVEALGMPISSLTLYTPANLTRQQARQVARDEPFRVLDIRMHEHDPAGGVRDVEWTKRWLVRGHWRDQPCGPGRTLRKLTWIQPYVKGPEDMPLDIRPTVFGADDE